MAFSAWLSRKAVIKMGQTDRRVTGVWYTDRDGVRFREGDEVFYEYRGRMRRCTVLMLYERENVPMVALGGTFGTTQALAQHCRVWPNGK